MGFVRPRRHLFAAIWLAFQVAWLSAVVPRNCCAAHKPEESCHETAASEVCPMQAADGTPCPMHRRLAEHDQHAAAGVEHHHQPAPLTTDCGIRSACDGPMSALFTLLSTIGVLPASAVTMPSLSPSADSLALRENVVGRLASPDAPPPRL
jgi:hypothetical protein